jgi:TonB family protein
MVHNKVKSRILLLLLSGTMLLLFALPCVPQDVDPFYLRILEKAEKSFLSRDYPQAVRDLEVAAFGLAGDSRLRAKALIYLGLAHFYLNDVKSAGKSLTEAASLLSEAEWSDLGIAAEAHPDLERLWRYFDLSPEIPVVSTPPDEPPQKAADSSLPSPGERTASPPTLQADPGDPLNMDRIKEGDLVPLELVEAPPEVTKKVGAAYPAWARSSGLEPRVIVNALVSEKGKVVRTEIIEGAEGAAGFNQAAEQAVRRWRFKPATVKGIRVKVWLPVAVEFKKQQ